MLCTYRGRTHATLNFWLMKGNLVYKFDCRIFSMLTDKLLIQLCELAHNWEKEEEKDLYYGSRRADLKANLEVSPMECFLWDTVMKSIPSPCCIFHSEYFEILGWVTTVLMYPLVRRATINWTVLLSNLIWQTGKSRGPFSFSADESIASQQILW